MKRLKMDAIKKVFTMFLLLLFFIHTSCSVESGSETFYFERDTPAWLQEKIDSITDSSGHYYDLTKIFRYDWDESYIYYFSIPMSSCMYCELYDQQGQIISAYNDSTLQSILKNKINELLIWENKK